MHSSAGVEYKAISTNLIFNVSMPIHVVSIPIFDDLVVDNTKSFSVALTTNDSAVTLRLQTASVRIYDNDSKLHTVPYHIVTV